jgi:hypothetical protein
MKTVIQLTADGYYSGLVTAHESPLEPGVYHYPANSVDAPQPNIPANHLAKWANGQWAYEEIVPYVVPKPTVEALQAQLTALQAQIATLTNP